MRRASQTAVALVAVLLALTTNCSKRDKVISVDDGDLEMTSAIAKARETLPQFWKVFEKPERGESDFALKVKITDNGRVEHFWVADIERRDGRTTGTINNDPNSVANIKLGDRIEIPEADITDWLYIRGGKMVGNLTLKPLFKHMPTEEVERLKEMMADP